MKKLLSLLFLASASLLGQDLRQIVVPHELENAVGNAGAIAPFNVSAGGSARYQQVYDASEFSGVGAPDLLIVSLYFRTDESGGAVRATIPDIQFDLSTTPKAPDALSQVFAENVGSDVKTVFGSGPVSLRTFGPVAQPLMARTAKASSR